MSVSSVNDGQSCNVAEIRSYSEPSHLRISGLTDDEKNLRGTDSNSTTNDFGTAIGAGEVGFFEFGALRRETLAFFEVDFFRDFVAM